MQRESSLPIWPSIASRAAKAYVAGAGLSDALRTLRQVDRDGLSGTIGYWNKDHDSPRRVATLAFLTVDALAGLETDATLSVKANAFGFDYGIVTELLDHASRRGVGVHFDALGPETADRTFALIASCRAHHTDLGCTLPGRWRRSLRDAETAIDMGLAVRVVKGQWSESGAAAADPGMGFLDVVDRLAGRAGRVGVATHDAPLAQKALARLHVARTPSELQVLLGFNAASAMREADAAGVPVRVYIPYGAAHLPYTMSEARHNFRVFWWLVRDVVRGRSG